MREVSRVKVTHQHGRRTQYRLQGGAWDGPDLDTLLRDTPRPRIGAPHDALVDGDIRLTATDVDDLASALAGGLRDLGVRRRDAVAWQLATGYEAVLLFRACWRLGAVAVPVPPHADDQALEPLLDAVRPVVVVGAKHLALGRHPDAVVVGGPTLPSRRPGARGPGLGAPAGAAGGSGADTTRSGAPFARLLAAAPVTGGGAQAADVAVVLPVGVDRGRPRGAIHTHRTLAAKARTMPERDGLGSADIALVAAPLTSAIGLLQAVVVPTLVGMTTVLLPEWNPAIALDVIERERVSFLAGPPSAIRALLREPSFSTRRVRSVRLVSLAGDAVSPTFAAQAAVQLDASVKRSYGSAEAPMVTASSPAARADELQRTDGRAIGDTELRVVDPTSGRDRAVGEEGELWLRGPELFAGYLSADDTADAFARGGWYRSGDLGRQDADGTVTVTGRIDDGIDGGDGPVGVRPLEAWLQAHDRIDDAVVVRDPRGGPGRAASSPSAPEVPVVAFVTLPPSTTGAPADGPLLVRDEAAAWLAHDEGAPAVTLVDVRVVRSLPLRPSGQVDRAALRARVAPRAGTASPL